MAKKIQSKNKKRSPKDHRSFVRKSAENIRNRRRNIDDAVDNAQTGKK